MKTSEALFNDQNRVQSHNKLQKAMIFNINSTNCDSVLMANALYKAERSRTYRPDAVVRCAEHVNDHLDHLDLRPARQEWLVSQQLCQYTSCCPVSSRALFVFMLSLSHTWPICAGDTVKTRLHSG